jgi:hypothetical protein
MEKGKQELIREREKRVQDAIALKVPDRVPFFPTTNLLAVKYSGITAEEAFYDHEAWFLASKKMNLNLEPDLISLPLAALPGRVFDAVQCEQIKWPGGGGAPPHSGIQFVENDYMKDGEYSQFLDDPTDYLIRTYMPRVFGILDPLKKLPSLRSLFFCGYRGALSASLLVDPEISRALKSFYKAGVEAIDYYEAMTTYLQEMAELGFPAAYAGAPIYAPFDAFADMHRGMRGSMLDMYREPDKLLEAIDKIIPSMLELAVSSAKSSENPRIFIPLHKGADGFMSDDQFRQFYWPGLKKILLSLIDEGLTPCPFFEGSYSSRLEYLTELPKGKILGHFDNTDIREAKEVLGDTMCISGNMPSYLLQWGSPEEIKEYAGMLIDIAGKGGGFIMSSRTVLDEAKPELVKIWADYTKEYGAYE